MCAPGPGVLVCAFVCLCVCGWQSGIWSSCASSGKHLLGPSDQGARPDMVGKQQPDFRRGFLFGFNSCSVNSELIPEVFLHP